MLRNDSTEDAIHSPVTIEMHFPPPYFYSSQNSLENRAENEKPLDKDRKKVEILTEYYHLVSSVIQSE